MKQTMVICAYPASGKTYICNKYNKLKGGNIMDKKVKYKKLAERAFRQALKDEEYSHICIDSQVVSLMHNSDIERYYNTKKKFKKLKKKLLQNVLQ